MQGPPTNLTMPDVDDDPVSPAMLKLILLTVAVTLATFLLLHTIQSRADARAQDRYTDCVLTTPAIQAAVEPCVKTLDTPWYAAQPGWTALGLGLAVLVLGRLWLFMARMERSRGV